MQTLQKISEHYGLHNDVPVSFKKRAGLLERLKVTHEEAWEKVSVFVTAHITCDRIRNDKEKQLKKREHWESEVKMAEQALLDSEEALKSFCNKQSISIN